MISFCGGVVLLILGYLLYSRYVEHVFGADPEQPMPCDTMRDDVDYLPLPTWRVYLIQFLNIAGTGPILGAIAGILFGPAAYLWIVLGCIFAGATHDYLSAMISLRGGGKSLPEIIGDQLGNTARLVMRSVSLVLLILVGAVFVMTPAGLLVSMVQPWMPDTVTHEMLYWCFCLLIFLYYFLATLLPISSLIGKIYPAFAAALLIMAAGLLYGLFTQTGAMPEVSEAFCNHHPNESKVLFPMLFITIACGAISGFHATQSPMMARCLRNERHGRHVFYGAMITEGLVALIWAAAAIKWANGDYAALASSGTAAQVVGFICNDWMGTFGAILAILGVVAAPITTGDTALRSARLTMADMFHFGQDTVLRRLILAVPVFAVAFGLLFVDFDVLWRYFGWVNQSLGVFTLWAVTVWLAARKKNYLITLLPALFMTVVCMSFILVCPTAEGGFGLSLPVSLGGGVAVAAYCLFLFLYNKPHLKIK